MTESLQKALDNFKQFVEKDLNGKITEEYDIVPEIWQDNAINIWSKDKLTHIKATYHKGETLILIILNEEYLDKSIKEFREFIDNIDDDIFAEACEMFINTKGEYALVELDNYLHNKSYYKTLPLMRDFVECVSKIAKEKIESMILKYFPEYKEFIKINGIKKINNPKDINELD